MQTLYGIATTAQNVKEYQESTPIKGLYLPLKERRNGESAETTRRSMRSKMLIRKALHKKVKQKKNFKMEGLVINLNDAEIKGDEE